MQIKIGSDRIVFVLPKLGFVIKLPIFHLFEIIEHHYYLIKDRNKYIKGGFNKLFKRYFKTSMGYRMGFKGAVLGGMHANWLEYLFWKRTRNPFLRPTYFSLFGLINIQKYGNLCRLDEIDFLIQLRILTKDKIYDNPHHFSNPGNYVLENKKLQITDYGSRRDYGVIVRYGKKIVAEFNPSYSWVEEKKKLQAEGK